MYNANKQELEIVEFWKKNKTFEKSVESKPVDKPYVFYDGPPFATGLPHYGHILSSVAKDVVPRYWAMKGYRVRRRWGWDCHGLPIESLIEKQLAISGKKDIEEKIGVQQFNDTCRAAVLKYAQDWKSMVERMGRWVEFDTAYKTMDTTYMESIWWALKIIWDKGLIYEGRKVLMYCTRCETPVAKAEIAMDHSYKEVTEEAVTVKFPISHSQFPIEGLDESKRVYILAWTTTPWTLPGNVALAVGPDIEYTLVQFKEAYYILAKDRLLHVFDPEKDEFTVVANIRGSELLNIPYEPLFDMPTMHTAKKKGWYVVSGDFVTTEEGTGIVHTAVIYGEDDYNLGLKYDLPMVPMLDQKGHYTEVASASIQGKFYKQAEKDIKRELDEKGLLFSREQHTHSYPHCWRCDTALIYNAISAWFINIQQIKERMIELNKRITWIPEHLKHGRFNNILETAPDWNISRNRYWATALPFWKHKKDQETKSIEQEDCTNMVCVGSIGELKEMASNFDEVFPAGKEVDLHKHDVDRIVLRCKSCGESMYRIPEVIDCWFEAGSMPYAELHYPFENKELFEQRFPGQYIAEYIAQTRAWFYYMHAVSTLLFDSHSFDNVVCTGTILNEKGEKLSKSKKNYTDPWAIIEQYGMDALRHYLMTSVVMQADNLLFSDREVRDVYNKVINTLWNVVEFYGMYSGAPSSLSPKGKGETTEVLSGVLDQWILARLGELLTHVTEHMDHYNIVTAYRPIQEFIEDLSTWYVRRSRDRFKGMDEADKTAAQATLREVLLTLSKIIAPVMPFMAEKVYQEVKGHRSMDMGQESVHLEAWPAPVGSIDTSLLEEMAKARKVVEMGLALRKEGGIRVRQPLGQLSIENCQLTNDLLAIIAEELNVKQVYIVPNNDIVQNEEWKVKEDAALKVALHIQITDELKKEGLLREIIRAINQMRKEQMLTPKDVVIVSYSSDDPMVTAVFEEYTQEILSQTRAKDLIRGEAIVSVPLADTTANIQVTKA